MGLLDTIDPLISLYDVRASQIAAARRQVTAATIGRARSALADTIAGLYPENPSVPRTITLELQGSGSPANSNNVQVAANPREGDVIATTQFNGVRTVALVTLDVVRNADGYAQEITESATALQTIHKTAAGFYVDEFSLSPGSLTVEVQVLYGTTPGSQVQSFFDLLNKAKLSDPFANEVPLVLRYHDTFLQRSLIITQDSVSLSISADRQNTARLSIRATVLRDYSQPSYGRVTPTPVDAAQQRIDVSGGLQSLGSFIAPLGGLIGSTIGAAR